MNIVDIIPFILLAALLAFCILIWVNKKSIIAPFKKIKRRTWIILILVLLAGFMLRFFVVEHMHNLYYDELGYLDIAKHLAGEGEKCLCLHNIDGECLICNHSLKALGFTALLAAFIKIFGLNAGVAFNMVAFIGVISIAMMFFFTYLLFQKESIALFSALILAFHPLHVRWSGSVSPEIVSLFFITLTFICLLLYTKSKVPLLIPSLLVLFFTLNIKQENIVALPFFALPFLARKEYLKKFLPIAGFMSVLAILSMIGLYITASGKALSPALSYTFWKQGKLLSIPLLKKHFLTSMKFFLDANYTPYLIIALTIVGFFLLFKKKKLLAITLLSGVIILPTLFTAYVGQALTGSEVRHYIPGLIPTVIFSSYALASMGKLSLRRVKASYIVALLVIVSVIAYIPYLTSKDSPYTPVQRDYEFVVESLQKIPKGCIIITQEPYIFDLHGQSATSIHLPNLYLNNDCMYYYEGESCYRIGLYKICNEVAETLALESKPYLSDGRHSFYKIKGDVLLNFN
ncbi:MAG: glycosyltransferase family 39 protein [Nanoarchaeota archaeon]|nr:glycosyltransferase family 39 protein [Nanoarchaeota archaeon]